MLKDKRGLGLNSAYGAVLMIVMVGIILGLGLYIMAETRTGVATDRTDTISANSSSGITMTDASLTNYELRSIESVIDSSSGTVYTNYTFTAAGVVTVGANDAGQVVNISGTYHYDATDSPEATMTTTITGLATFADWIAIIVVVLAAAIVLGIVLSSFGREPGV